jgi:isoaspartyl peptidase/L-asparaginase-like protein (Ntn-hydrolase superfamily)
MVQDGPVAEADPVIIATWSFAQRGTAAAWPALAGGGSSLDAVETACGVVERDPEVDSVGFGGLPDRAGAVTLDACVMVSPRACGSVCALSRHLDATSIARRVMERTPWAMLAGPGADAFADEQGFEPQTLLAPAAEARWRAWRRNPAGVDQSRDRGYAPLRPIDTGGGGELFGHDERHGTDTVCVLALDRAARLAGACSTSGVPYKDPGRVGDSPIIGQGLYVDPVHGAAAATGTGELVMGSCSSFLAVELMRRGATPLDALVEAIGRVRDDFDLAPEHQVAMIALRPDGATASAALRPGYRNVRTDARGTAVGDPEVVLVGE